MDDSTPDRPCVFVGGPIQNAIDSHGQFHSRTMELLTSIIAELVLRGYQVQSAHEYEQFGKVDLTGQSPVVCKRDFAWMKSCDMFVAVLPTTEAGDIIHTAGTCIELGWASAMSKPIVLITDPAAQYSHLVVGLDAVASVRRIDINHPELPAELTRIVQCLHKNSTDVG